MPQPGAPVPSASPPSVAAHAAHRVPPPPIAIIGMGCRLPGPANSPQALWQLLCAGVDAIREIPADRWHIPSFYDPEPGTPGKTYARWGGFIDGIAQFDAAFFGLSPREAAAMDPQHRLLLEVAYEALEDGGQPLPRLAGSATGVFIGISTHDYSRLQATAEDHSPVNAYTPTGVASSLAANRLSYCFNLRGPSLAVDTACSSALVAVHLACRSLWEGESTLALAGGVNVLLTPETFIGFSQASMLAPDGRCKAFDASGNGFVRSEGVGVVVLKPLAQALADGDPIYALIRGTAVNQDGRTTGIALPNQEAQIAMLRAAYRSAGVNPGQVQYVEAHGTGTTVGDPIEAQALGTVLSARRPAGQMCLLGSVKTNLGHLEAGAGIVGLIKTALALRHGAIPPHLHLRQPNPHIPFDALHLRIPQRLEPWPATHGGPRLAGVNAFGFGGTNAHVVMSDAPTPPCCLPRRTRRPVRCCCRFRPTVPTPSRPWPRPTAPGSRSRKAPPVPSRPWAHSAATVARTTRIGPPWWPAICQSCWPTCRRGARARHGPTCGWAMRSAGHSPASRGCLAARGRSGGAWGANCWSTNRCFAM